MSSPFAELTKSQKACLRLVFQLLSTKEIAAKLDLSPHSVDAYIKKAMKTLGAINRADAARILARYEAENQASEDWYYQSPDLFPKSDLTPSSDPVRTEIEANGAGDKDSHSQHKPKPEDADADSGDDLLNDASRTGRTRNSTAASAGSVGARKDDPSGRSRGSSDNLKVQSRRSGATDTPRLGPEPWGPERLSFRSRFGGPHDLSLVKKLGIILASAIVLIVVITAGLASLNSISELCAAASVCEWPRVQQSALVQPHGRTGDQNHEERYDRRSSQ